MRRSVFVFGGLLIGGLAIAAYQASGKLVLDGSTVSTRGIVQNGQLYVPAADVAKALGKSYSYDASSKTGTMTNAGGANQNEGTSGNAGEWITNGRTRMKLEPGFIERDGKKLLSFEFRNGETKPKIYQFGYNQAEYILYDEQGNSQRGQLDPKSNAFAPKLQPAAMQRFHVIYKFNDDFKPVRMVLNVGTQIVGNPPQKEVFRIKL